MPRLYRTVFIVVATLLILTISGFLLIHNPAEQLPGSPTSIAERAPDIALPKATPQALIPTATLARRDFIDTSHQKIAPTTFLSGNAPVLAGELVHSGRRLDVYVSSNTYSAEEVANLAIKAEYVVNYLQRRFDQELTRRVSVGFYSRGMAPSRDTRGIAYSQDNIIHIFSRSSDDLHGALVILAHELGHQLQADAYGDEAQRRADLVLLEGLATWISGEYWLSLSESSSFQVRARELYQAGYRGDLAALGRTAPTNIAYEMWAGFVEYIAVTYGWDKFNALYVSGRGRAAGSADYMGIYGKSFDELAHEWQATLK